MRRYVPGIVARGPFLIGFQERQEGGEMRREPVIHVDIEDPRVSQTEGEPVFLPQGGNSRYLDRVANILNGINEGIAASKAMFAAFTAAELIEPVKLEIKFNSDEQYNLRRPAHHQRSRSCASSTAEHAARTATARVSCRAPSWCSRR